MKSHSLITEKKNFYKRFILLLSKASVIIASNLFTWAPIAFLSLLAAINKSFLTQKTYNWVFIIILPLNSLLNVYIHSGFSIKFFLMKKKKLEKFIFLFFYFFSILLISYKINRKKFKEDILRILMKQRNIFLAYFFF